MVMDLKHKIIVITGGGSGLGSAIACSVAEKGAYVLICSRKKTDLKRVCDDIRARGGMCDYARVDVTLKQDLEAFIAATKRKFKKIDVFINNAGWVGMPKQIQAVSDREYHQYMETNTTSVFYVARKIIPLMLRQKSGIMITVGSTAGKRGNSLVPIYSASKFAAVGMAQAVDRGLEKSGVRSIVINPGGMNTSMRAKLLGKKEAATQQSPETVAAVVLDVLTGAITVPVGGDIEIRGGKFKISE